MKRVFLLAAAVMAVSAVSAAVSIGAKGGVKKSTYLYSVRGRDTLRLDRYEAVKSGAGHRPVLLFMFGGGFAGGQRDDADYQPFFEYMAGRGWCVVSIDYRLGLSNVGALLASGAKPDTQQMLAMLGDAIALAVEDLYDATSFVAAHADEWGVDSGRIVACGSSAGAISVLQGVCGMAGARETGKLPAGFSYAGVVSFAGAVFVEGGSGSLVPGCPALMFHGSSDSNVPYDMVSDCGAGLYGSHYIAAEMRRAGRPYWFYSVEGAGHELAVDPMNCNRAEICSFLERYVAGGQELMTETRVSAIGQPAEEVDFGIEDYIRANFGM